MVAAPFILINERRRRSLNKAKILYSAAAGDG